MDHAVAERLGQEVADRLDNCLALLDNQFMPAAMRIDAMQHVLPQARDAAREIYVALTGENPWDEGDDEG